MRDTVIQPNGLKNVLFNLRKKFSNRFFLVKSKQKTIKKIRKIKTHQYKLQKNN